MTEHTHPGYNQPMTPVQHPADGTPSPSISNATQLGSGTTEGGRVYFGDAASAYSDGHRDGTAATAARIAELEQLASDILNTYHPASDGHRGRVGQVQIAKWRKVLDGEK